MRRFLLIGLFLTLTASAAFGEDEKRPQQTEQKIAADSSVTVSLCLLAGDVKVEGWERNEVLARSYEGATIELRRGYSGIESKPAAKIQILVTDKDDGARSSGGCQSSSSVELMVPRGATVQVQTRDGNIHITGVATAYAGTQNGDINVERVTRVIEVGTIGGNVSVNDSSGRMDLNSIGGNVVVHNARPVNPDDEFEATSVSGDLELEGVTFAQMNLRTVNGNMRMVGPLVSGGHYGINTMSGDVTLSLPSDASFQLHAKVSSGADIITDFPLTLLTEASPVSKPAKAMPPSVVTPPQPATQRPASMTPASTPEPPDPPQTPEPQPTPGVVVKPAPKVKIKPEKHSIHSLRRLSAICGSGDAIISLASFSGTLHLQKN